MCAFLEVDVCEHLTVCHSCLCICAVDVSESKQRSPLGCYGGAAVENFAAEGLHDIRTGLMHPESIAECCSDACPLPLEKPVAKGSM